MPRLVLHITEQASWQAAKSTGFYKAAQQDEDGFIHCSTPNQLVKVANKLYRRRKGLVVLCIDPGKVRAELRFEKSGAEVYPHIYGPLNLDAVVAVLPFQTGVRGRYQMPGIPKRRFRS